MHSLSLIGIKNRNQKSHTLTVREKKMQTEIKDMKSSPFKANH